MAHLMLVNPKRKRRRAAANPRRKRRKMTAKQAQYFAPRRRKRRAATRKASPVRRRRRASSVRRFARSRRGSLNIGAITSGRVLESTVLPAAIGALGAVALDAAYAYLPIPANLKAGQFAAPVKAAVMLGVGALASNVLPRQRGLIENAVAASLTIMAYNFIKAQVQTMLPGVSLGEYVDGIGYTGAGQFLPDYSMSPALQTPLAPTNVGEYVSGADAGYNTAWANSVYGDEVF